MKKYHRFVFDEESRRFVGAFEEMYQAEKTENFDSWHQEDTRALHKKVMLSMFESLNFEQIIDLGCGKGNLTHCLKKANNEIFAVDISETAVGIARERYPDIHFMSLDVNDMKNLEAYFNNLPSAKHTRLVFISELLSYLSNWKELLSVCSHFSDYLLISLYLPDNPIGFVKSHSQLSETVSKHFQIMEEVILKVEKFQIILAARK